MILDTGNLFSDAQSLTGTSAVVSTSSVDLGSARDVGSGENVELFCSATASGGTSPTLAVEIIGADDAALTSNIVVYASVPAVALAAPQDIVLPSLPVMATKKRYLGLRYTQGGTSPTSTVTAGIVMDKQTNFA
jgi:hypothetical protein